MAIKNQTQSYREAGKWVCWCDGLADAATIAKNIRRLGYKAKREGDRVFVLASEADKIPS